LQFYQQGLEVAEIAAQRNLKSGTIYNHLSELIEMNQPVDLNRFVLPAKKKIILQAIKTHSADSLTVLKEYLGENYSYEEIKLVRAWWRRESTNNE
jgi:ATP-dependent DNA helicase RecQ